MVSVAYRLIATHSSNGPNQATELLKAATTASLSRLYHCIPLLLLSPPILSLPSLISKYLKWFDGSERCARLLHAQLKSSSVPAPSFLLLLFLSLRIWAFDIVAFL